MADFINALKQRLLPDFTGASKQPNSIQQPGSRRPPQQMAGPAALRLGIGDILAPGGTNQIADISNSYWFSALQPVAPVGAPSSRPRQSAFTPGANMVWGAGEDKNGITFEMLRTLADSWDLLRLVIETRKDQMCGAQWEIRPRRHRGETNKDYKQRAGEDPNVTQLTNFFNYPDGYHNWRTWSRMWFEDMLVLDAVALYYQRDVRGRIANISPLDGGTITRLLDDLGTTPKPPSVAYQQVVYGFPNTNLTTDDLLYGMRNERTHKRYGYSPVEQILVTIGIALKKQQFLSEYYTSGNMPEALCFLPSSLSPDRVNDVQEWFDSVLSGDLGKRRRLTFLPGYGTGSGTGSVTPNVVFPKEALLKDELDEWLLRVVAYAFSVSPQNLMKQMNRASAEMASTVAQMEGQEPALATVADLHNQIIHDLGMDADYEFAYKESRDTDPEKAATIDNILCGKISTINEIREDRGQDRRAEPEADMLGTFGPTGFIPLQGSADAVQGQRDSQVQQAATSQQMQQAQLDQMQNPTDSADSADGASGDAAEGDVQKLFRFRKLDTAQPGEFVHPVFGDLCQANDTVLAYDEASDTFLVKGQIDQVDLARAVKQFQVLYPELV